MIRTFVRGLFAVVAAAAAMLVCAASAAAAAPQLAPEEPNKLLSTIIENATGLVQGVAFGVATLFLTIGCVRYMMANGDPTITEKGKSALKTALGGYALALLAEPLLGLVKSLVV